MGSGEVVSLVKMAARKHQLLKNRTTRLKRMWLSVFDPAYSISLVAPVPEANWL